MYGIFFWKSDVSSEEVGFSSINRDFLSFMIFFIRLFCLNNVCNFLLFDFLGSFIPFLFKKSKDWISVNPIGKSPFYFSQNPSVLFFGETLRISLPLYVPTFWSTINIGSDKKQKAGHFYATLDAFEIVFKMHNICQL